MKSKFALFLVAASMLASCGGTSPSHTGGFSSQDTSVAPASATYLDWVSDGKIVIDLFTAGQANFAYGNAALTSETTTLDLSDNASITCSTQLKETTLVNFVVVTEASVGTGFNAGAAVYAGIEGDKVSDFLKDNDDLKGKIRAYVAISLGDTVAWTKGKNTVMDAKIQSLVDIAKK